MRALWQPLAGGKRLTGRHLPLQVQVAIRRRQHAHRVLAPQILLAFPKVPVNGAATAPVDRQNAAAGAGSRRSRTQRPPRPSRRQSALNDAVSARHSHATPQHSLHPPLRRGWRSSGAQNCRQSAACAPALHYAGAAHTAAHRIANHSNVRFQVPSMHFRNSRESTGFMPRPQSNWHYRKAVGSLCRAGCGLNRTRCGPHARC